MPIITTGDGAHTLLSETYGVTYHSKFGAITESLHVFIAAGLRYKAVVQQEIKVLETGLGTGLNALLTQIEAEKRGLQVDYTALELYPLDLELVKTLNFAETLQQPERQADFLKIHLADWDIRRSVSPHFSFLKKQLPIETFVEPEAYDLIYFDAFAPQAQPELWTDAVFQNMYASLRPEGVLVTYCAQGEFKRRLKRAGFSVERLQGPPGKREMTRAGK